MLNRVYVGFSGISKKDKPVASFLLLGPTGTGKCIGYDQEVTIKISDDMYQFAVDQKLM
jgi:ATP-dependent Clp protease ATP-binding subunit ClpA